MTEGTPEIGRRFWISFLWPPVAVAVVEIATTVYLAVKHPEIGGNASLTYYVAIAGAVPVLLLAFTVRVREVAMEIGGMVAAWESSRDLGRTMLAGLPELRELADQKAGPDDSVWSTIARLEKEEQRGEWAQQHNPNLRKLASIAYGYGIEAAVLALIGEVVALTVLAGAASTTLTVALGGFAVVNLLLLFIVRELARLRAATQGRSAAAPPT